MKLPAFFRFPSRRRLLIYAVVIAALATCVSGGRSVLCSARRMPDAFLCYS